MEGTNLRDLEGASRTAVQDYLGKKGTMEAAQEKAASADAAYRQAVNEMSNQYGGVGSPDSMEKFQDALKAKQEADAQKKEAEGAFEEAAKSAQDAADAVEDKKNELRASRTTDTSYVVHTARIECSCGLRESYLVLGVTHGVITSQVPQMIVSDDVLNSNVVNFGGCISKENPTLIAAAQQAAEAAQAEIAEKKGFFDHVVEFFTGDKSKATDVQDSLMEQCVGECIGQFPQCWAKVHEKVTVNGQSPLLRRCELVCKYGGIITILLSGQPE